MEPGAILADMTGADPLPAASATVREPAASVDVPAQISAGTSGGNDEQSRRNLPAWVAPLLLVVLPLVLYVWAIRYPLLNLDDAALYSATLLHGGNWRGLYDVFTDVWFVDYSPITLLTMWVDLALGDADGHWYVARIDNPLWLGFGAIAVYCCLRRIIPRRLAFAAALIYVVHPLCANATLWLAERKNLVSFALSWWCLERYIASRSWPDGRAADSTSGSAGPSRRRMWRFSARDAAWVLGILALLAKPQSVAIPVMMAAWEFTLGPDAASPGATGVGATLRSAIANLARPLTAIGLFWRRVAPVLPAVLVVALYVVVQLHYRTDFAASFLGGSRVAAVWCDGWIFAQYLLEIVVPRNLTIYYAVVDEPGRIGLLAASWLAVLAVIGATIAIARRRATVCCGWFLAIAAMAPALNLVKQAAPMSDHYIQWGLPGILIAVLITWEDACARWKFDISEAAQQLALVAAVTVLGICSIARVPEFANRDTFFTYGYIKQPDAPMNLAGYVDALVNSNGNYHRDSGALAIAALNNPHGRILVAFQTPVLIEAAVESWRRAAETAVAAGHPADADAAGRAAAWKVAKEIGNNEDEFDFVWARVLIGIGGPPQFAEADRMLAQHLGKDFLDHAMAISQQCRNGTPMPDEIPAAITIYLRANDDPFMFRTNVMSLLRLSLALAEVRLREGAYITDPAAQSANDDSALGLALLSVNLDPDYTEARRMAGVMYAYIERPDLAKKIDPSRP